MSEASESDPAKPLPIDWWAEDGLPVPDAARQAVAAAAAFAAAEGLDLGELYHLQRCENIVQNMEARIAAIAPSEFRERALAALAAASPLAREPKWGLEYTRLGADDRRLNTVLAVHDDGYVRLVGHWEPGA
jgi:hypothetical protein